MSNCWIDLLIISCRLIRVVLVYCLFFRRHLRIRRKFVSFATKYQFEGGGLRGRFILNSVIISREQVNQVTGYLDASVVYGSDENVAKILRAHTGQLNQTKLFTEDDNKFRHLINETAFLIAYFIDEQNKFFRQIILILKNNCCRWPTAGERP